MMKRILSIVGVLGLVGIIGFGIYQSNASTGGTVAKEDIFQLIEANYEGRIVEFEVDEKNNRKVYEIEVVSDGVEYELTVDAATGEIIREKIDNISRPATAEKEQTTKKEQFISKEEASKIALNIFPGTIKELEFDEDDGRYIYEIEVKNGNREAEFDIDAITGEIIKQEIDPERKTAKQPEKKQEQKVSKPKTEQPKKQHQEKAQKNEQKQVQKSQPTKPQVKEQKKAKSEFISREQAIQIALNIFSGTVKEVEFDKDDGRYIYEIEIKNGKREAEFDIDARTGKILKQEIDPEVKVEKPKEKKSQFISREKAIQIALGIFSGTVTEVELDEDDGRYVYEIEIERDDQEAEIEIDAVTGKVLEVDIDED